MNVTEDRGRITARVSLPVEEKLKEAAELAGATLNQFLVQAALEKADKIIDRERMIKVTAQDATLLLSLLDNPPRPNAALKRAFERSKNKDNNAPRTAKQKTRS